MLSRTLLLLLLGGFSAAPATAQAPPADPKAAPATVPFKLLPSRHMLVELTFNGKGPFRVIFDTGAPLNLVNPKLAKESGLLKKGESGGMSLFSLSGPKTIDVAKVGFGTATLTNLPVIVMDHPTVKAISNAFEDEYGTIDGIVGFPLFSRFATTVDYQKRELTLVPSAYKPGDYLKDLTDTLTRAADSPGPKVVGAAGLWGFRVAEGDSGEGAVGVVVKEVYADGPASKAGLKVGDRIATIDRRWTETVADAYLATSLVKPGRTVELAVARGAEKLTLRCTPVKGY